MAKQGQSAPVPIICIGNFVLGGGGKTPTAIAVAGLLQARGAKVGFLSRGYGGREAGPLQVDIDTHTAGDVGDEPLMLARAAPTVVSRDRPLGVRMLADLGVGVIVMDDGFQNPSLEKDLNIVVVDSHVGIGNARIFPAGPLRAPMAIQLNKADAIIRVGTGDGSGADVVRAAATLGLPILSARLEPVKKRGYKSKKYLAFAGIARPEKFFRTLEEAGGRIVERKAYPDHDPLSDNQCRYLSIRSRDQKLTPITTEKDAVRLQGRIGPAAELLADTQIFPVRMKLEEEGRLSVLIDPLLGA